MIKEYSQETMNKAVDRALKQGRQAQKQEDFELFEKLIEEMKWEDEFNDFYKDTMGGEDTGYELMRFILDKLKLALAKEK